MFWNGKKLESKISELIELDNSADIKTVKVDCASIELTVGSEVYITPSSENDPKVKRILTEKKSQFIIPKGQFYDIFTKNFITCHESCESCFGTNSNNCLTCYSSSKNSFLRNGECVEKCLSTELSYYESTNTSNNKLAVIKNNNNYNKQKSTKMKKGSFFY